MSIEPETQSTDLVLTPPNPVPVVETEKADGLVKIDPETSQRIDGVVHSYVESLVSIDPHSPDFAQKVGSIHNLGDKEIRESANVSNRMLDKPVKAMTSGPYDTGSTVSTALMQLRKTVEELDPSHHGITSRKFLGIPLGNALQNYFGKYQSSQTHINAIVNALYGGQDELRKDNASIEQEKANLWAIMERLQQYSYMARKLDAELDARITEIAATDPQRADALRQDLQFYVRQKLQDLLTQLAVSVQGYLALDLIRRNNLELIKGVDRATTTTVSALRTAVIVAQALGNQRLVLDQITALNTTTSGLIQSTSELLRKQTGQVHEQAASSTVGIEQLRAAFANIYATMDDIDTFKVKALDSMQVTVDALTGEVKKAQGYLERARSAPVTEDVLAAASSELMLPEGPKK